ncbi:hypothetical protein CCH79_00007245 [Gambusia affinis]|uniref:Iodothyronine deiodinase n=1 Tax=Gambusia affinis TaxID=33528 RepID=A0A315VCV1_GAMAF|nr:hypothetical protein CCH79_00007245 [Gambusia affinis]
MFKLDEFKQLVRDFGDVADFLVVYVAEAHSTDGWSFGNNFDISEHQSLEDRLSAAQILLQNDPLCPVVVDEMSNVSAIKYAAQPERLYVLQAGKVLYKGKMGPWGYNLLEILGMMANNAGWGGGDGTEVEGEGVTHSSSWWESTVEETKQSIRTNNDAGFRANGFPEALLLRSLANGVYQPTRCENTLRSEIHTAVKEVCALPGWASSWGDLSGLQRNEAT